MLTAQAHMSPLEVTCFIGDNSLFFFRAVTTFFLFVTRAFATGVFQAVYVYTPEVYATNIRASALGLHTAAARVGALLTPYNAQV